MRDPIPGYTGIINRNTNPYDVAQLAMCALFQRVIP